jgi:hypothetical protein
MESMKDTRTAAAIGAATCAIWCGLCFFVTPEPARALASPTLTGQASTPALAGGSLTDTATLAGGASPTGTITFQLVQGGTCGNTPIFTSVKTVSGNGSYTSDPYSPLADGFYSWLVSYSGDLANSPVSTVCDDGSDTVVVPQYCPPHACSPPPPGSCGHDVTNTTSESTQTCVGSPSRLTVGVVTVVGPAYICIGDEKQMGFCVVPGGEDINTIVETVFVNAVAVPTVSVWGLGALFVGLGALALRRLRLRSVS